jgi:hypothetical protein
VILNVDKSLSYNERLGVVARFRVWLFWLVRGDVVWGVVLLVIVWRYGLACGLGLGDAG